MVIPRQGEIWWAETKHKRRPVLVVTRSDAIPVLTMIMCAPITRTVRGIPTEIALDRSHGLQVSCAASFDNMHLVSRLELQKRIGALAQPRTQICKALTALADC